nr:MAG TPA: hypothetical protein [Caudoviricetes sp.]
MIGFGGKATSRLATECGEERCRPQGGTFCLC